MIKLVVINVLVILSISRNTKQHYDWLWLKNIINPCGANSVQQMDFGGGFIILLNGLLWQWKLYSKKVFKTRTGFKKTSVFIPAFKKGRMGEQSNSVEKNKFWLEKKVSIVRK